MGSTLATNIVNCDDCRVGARCCTRDAGAPDISRYDVYCITQHPQSRHFSWDRDSFEKYLDDKESLLPSIRLRTDGTCMFLSRDGKCEIYECRPIDCQLFPLDIDWDENANTYVWVLYHEFCECPINLGDVELRMREAEETLLPHFREDELLLYAQHRSRLLKSGQGIRLRDVEVVSPPGFKDMIRVGDTVR